MKIIKYFFVGGTAAIVDIGLFAIFAKYLEFNYLMVGFFSFTIATLVNYLLSIRHVFESGVRFSKKKEITIIYIVSAFGLAINLFVLYSCVELVGVGLIVSKLIATGVVFFWNYFIRREFVFKDVAIK